MTIDPQCLMKNPSYLNVLNNHMFQRKLNVRCYLKPQFSLKIFL